jgi:hypothetical protein
MREDIVIVRPTLKFENLSLFKLFYMHWLLRKGSNRLDPELAVEVAAPCVKLVVFSQRKCVFHAAGNLTHCFAESVLATSYSDRVRAVGYVCHDSELAQVI